MLSRRALPLGRGAVVTAVGTVTVLLVVWASAVPLPARVISSPTATFTNDPTAPLDDSQAPQSQINAPPFTGTRRDGGLLDAVLGYGTAVLLGVAVLFLLALVARQLLDAYRDRGVVVGDATAGPDVDRVAATVASDASGRLAALSGGSPAEGIVAAWTRLEASLRDAGLPMPPSRTSTETTVAALGRYVVDAGALHALAALYREASWSHHPLTEDDRTRAEDALRALDAQLAPAREAGVRRG
ncbi:DUF4129 domain-containing protein [Phycicoccus duodecadis]|uniref:DUF4129 domain-containing protein n=1 Tax=Phycicoccus duodecadis TaxID=173053 RepID=UPI000C70F6C8|nr:DUF4129 domain-containing protein [Phycicoccus duodecadis]